MADFPPESTVEATGLVTLKLAKKNDEHWNWSHEQPIARTETEAKATETREKMRRAFENIVQVGRSKGE